MMGKASIVWILILRKAFVGEVVGRMHLIVVQIVRSLI